MKIILTYFVMALTVATGGMLCQSCADGNGEPFSYSYLGEGGDYSSLGTVMNSDDLLVESDSYGLLQPVNTEIFADNDADTIGQRVLMGLTFIDEEESVQAADTIRKVWVKQLYKVLTKAADDLRADTSSLSTQDIEDEFGNQPIWVVTASISELHLNIQFNVKGHDADIAHRITLLLTDESTLDSGGLLRVELRHNPEDDTQEDLFWGVVSFTLSSIPECSDADFKGFRIIYNTGEEDAEEYIVTLSGSENDSRSGATGLYSMPIE